MSETILGVKTMQENVSVGIDSGSMYITRSAVELQSVGHKYVISSS